MTYPVNGAIPQPGDDPSQSQAAILTNFANIVGWSGVDHIAYGATNDGQHKQITLPTPLTVDPTPASTASELYSKAVSAVGQLFFANSAGVNQLTGSIITVSGNDGLAGTYQIFQTPWGIRLFMGNTASISGANTLTLSSGTFGSTIYTSLATCHGGGAQSVNITPNASLATFVINTSSANQVRWLIITN